MDHTIRALEIVNDMGAISFISIILTLAICAFIVVFCWATIRYVPPFCKNTGRIADNLEAMNKSHHNIETNVSRLPLLDDKIDRITIVLDDVKKKVEENFKLLLQKP